MYCWKCGQELTDGAGSCVYCGANQKKPEPGSEVGVALRTLYDRYGRDTVMNNPLMLVNGLGDLVEDSQKLRGQMKMAMDAGMGRMLLDQLNSAGMPDAAFDARLKVLLTDDAGLSDRIAGEIVGYMDEMIGWRSRAKNPSPEPKPEPEKAPPATPNEEIDRATGQVYKKPGSESSLQPEPQAPGDKKKRGRIIALVVILAIILGGGVFLLSQNARQTAVEPESTSAPTTGEYPAYVEWLYSEGYTIAAGEIMDGYWMTEEQLEQYAYADHSARVKKVKELERDILNTKLQFAQMSDFAVYIVAGKESDELLDRIVNTNPQLTDAVNEFRKAMHAQ